MGTEAMVRGTPGGMGRKQLLEMVKERLPLRWFMLIILALTGVAWLAINASLYAWGLTDLVARYSVCAFLTYLAFFPIVKGWLYAYPFLFRFLRNGADRVVSAPFDSLDTGLDVCNLVSDLTARGGDAVQASAHLADAARSAGDLVETTRAVADAGRAVAEAGQAATDGGSVAADAASGLGCLDADAIVLAVIGLFIGVIFSVFIFFVYNAPDILSETILQIAVGAGETAGMADWSDADWKTVLAEQTIGGFLLALLSCFMIGVVTAGHWPGATTMAPAWKALWKAI
ncbi:MAG: hypothetical protein GX442_25165 [Candidatus Riflebacteria bacterium]|nr:hypothetical protein [Candidatus Riflebacteria bacterium]